MAYPKLDTPEVRAAQKDFATCLRGMLDGKCRSIKDAAEKGHTTSRIVILWLKGNTDPNPRKLRQFTAGNGFDHRKLVRALRWNDPAIKL